MTESLTQKIEAKSKESWEEYKEANTPIGQAALYYQDNREYFLKGHSIGASDLHKILLEGGPEFDLFKVSSSISVEMFSEYLNRQDMDTTTSIIYREGARWQHAQDKAYLAARDAEIERLKGELKEQKDAYEFMWKMRIQDEMERNKK